jgi:hypothetical protein
VWSWGHHASAWPGQVVVLSALRHPRHLQSLRRGVARRSQGERSSGRDSDRADVHQTADRTR